MTQTSASADMARILCVMSDEQHNAYEVELGAMRQPTLDFVFETSGDDAIALVGEVEPALVIVGMDIGDMEGLEFVALLMNQYKDFSNKVIVLPDKGDPFPPVVQHRDNSTGQSSTKNITLPDIAKLVSSLAPPAPEGGAAPLAPSPAAPPPAVAAPVVAPPPAAAPKAPAAPALDDFADAPAIADGPADPEPETPDPIDEGFPAADMGSPLAGVESGGATPKWVVPVAVLAVVAVIVGVMSSSDEAPDALKAESAAVAEAAEGSEPKAAPVEAAPAEAEPTAKPAAEVEAAPSEAAEPAAAGGPGLERGKLTTLPLRFAKGRITYVVTDEPQLAGILSGLTSTLASDADASVEVGGHASTDGTGENNVTLGRRRAIAIRRYLIEQGVAAGRVKVRNYHTSKAAADGQGPASHRGNRRVTLLVR